MVTAVCLTACSTTHNLGRLGDPGTMAQVNALAARPGTMAEVVPLPGSHQPAPSYAVTKSASDGLIVSARGGSPKLLPYAQVQSLSSYDRPRGARNGALIVGIPAFVVGFFLGTTLAGGAKCSDACSAQNDPTTVGLKVGSVSALLGAALGGAIGALAGYRDRYVIELP